MLERGAPCNIALSRQAQSVKKGVIEAGGTPREFTTITVTDGIAMGHQGMKSSLVSREVILDHAPVLEAARADAGREGARMVFMTIGELWRLIHRPPPLTSGEGDEFAASLKAR